jgi:hypothetical protein
MRASRYQQLLGLPPEIVSPDYYQLLGIERGFIDHAAIQSTLQERAAKLDAAGDPAVAEFLKRELDEARATITDPNKREAYDQLLERQRLDELKKLVPAMLVSKTLTAAAEKAITAHAAAAGLDPRRMANAIGEAIRDAGATRGPRDEPSEEQVAKASAQMRIALRPIADQQLEAAMKAQGVTPVETARPETVEAPPEPVEAPPEPPAPPPVEPPPAEPPPPVRPRPTTRNVLPPAETKSRSATGARPAVKKPPTEALPAAEPMTPEEATAVKMTELYEKINQLEKTKAIQRQNIDSFEPEMERIRRKLRRVSRSLATALVASLAFIAGHLARVIPGLAAKIDEFTAPTRAQIVESQSTTTVAGIAGGSALVLFVLALLLAGMAKKAPFLVPTIILALAALGAGAILMR